MHLNVSWRTWWTVRAERISLMQARITNKRMASGAFDVWFEVLVVVFGRAASVLALLCAAALVEVFRQLGEIRNKLEIDDQPLRLELEPRGLPVALVPGEPLAVPSAALVFLHGRCGTCRMVAEAFKGSPPERTWFVLPAGDADAS